MSVTALRQGQGSWGPGHTHSPAWWLPAQSPSALRHPRSRGHSCGPQAASVPLGPGAPSAASRSACQASSPPSPWCRRPCGGRAPGRSIGTESLCWSLHLGTDSSLPLASFHPGLHGTHQGKCRSAHSHPGWNASPRGPALAALVPWLEKWRDLRQAAGFPGLSSWPRHQRQAEAPTGLRFAWWAAGCHLPLSWKGEMPSNHLLSPFREVKAQSKNQATIQWANTWRTSRATQIKLKPPTTSCPWKLGIHTADPKWKPTWKSILFLYVWRCYSRCKMNDKLIQYFIFLIYVFVCFCSILGFVFRAASLWSRCASTWATPQPFFALVIFQIGSCWPGPLFSYLCLQNTWNYRNVPTCLISLLRWSLINFFAKLS
jgi:hypothetical protein